MAETPTALPQPGQAPETKEFWKTSEFWVMIATNIAALINEMQPFLPERYTTIAAMVVNGLYILSRGIAKQGISPRAPQAPTVVVTPAVVAPAATIVEPSPVVPQSPVPQTQRDTIRPLPPSGG